MNFDATGLRLVVKGLRVAIGDRQGLVVKVSRGSCLVRWDNERYAAPARCLGVTVL